MSYDGFISYSHAADDLLAPRLQSGLQRFAKPWWKRRALRVFRDESSLSANPHLWESITAALDTSGWFVLLLSPEAAASEWVNQEIAYWVEHKDPSRILPVVTAGEFGWADGDVSGDAVPDALRGVLASEPRWVDLRFARGEEQLSLQDPRFADAIADVASAMRGVPKDELAGEEVRQHRRTVRTAWAVGVLLFSLAATAVWVGALSARNAEQARENAAVARAQADRADQNAAEAEASAEAEAEARGEAEASSEEAKQERNNAQEAAALSQSQAWAAASASVLESDPELAQLLAVLSIREAPGVAPVESLRALRKASEANRLRYRIPIDGVFSAALLISDDGRVLFAGIGQGALAAFDLATGEELWVADLGGAANVFSVALDPFSSHLWVGAEGADPREGLIFMIAPSDGAIVARWSEPCAPWWLPGSEPFTPDGSVLALSGGYVNCSDRPGRLSLRDSATLEEVGSYDVPGAVEEVTASFSDDGSRIVLSDGQTAVEILTWPGLEVIRRFEGFGLKHHDASMTRVALFRPDEGNLARVRLYDVDSGEFLGFAENRGDFIAGAWFSPSGQEVLVTSRQGRALVSALDGRFLTRLGSGSAAWVAAFSPDGRTLVTSGPTGLSVWDLNAQQPLDVQGLGALWFNPDTSVEGLTRAVVAFVGSWEAKSGVGQRLAVINDDNEVEAAIPAEHAGQLADGRFVIAGREPAGVNADGSLALEGVHAAGLAIWDPSTGQVEQVTDCPVPVLDLEIYERVAPTVTCPDGSPVYAMHEWAPLVVSPDRRSFAVSSALLAGEGFEMCAAEESTMRSIGIWSIEPTVTSIDLRVSGCLEPAALGDGWIALASYNSDLIPHRVMDFDGRVIAELDGPIGLSGSEFFGGGEYLVAASEPGAAPEVAIYETRGWTVVARWEAHSAWIRGISVSVSADRLATASEDGVVRIWNLESALDGTTAIGDAPPLLDELPVGTASDVIWRADGKVDVLIRTGSIETYSLDPDVVARRSLDSLDRSFTDAECRNYRIDPCPTIEEMREDS